MTGSLLTRVSPVWPAWFLLAAFAFGLAAPRLDRPGVYYDEAFLAQQAADFLEPDRAGPHPGSVREVWLAGRPFPLRNAVYLGSLKSQLLIPSFALFGVSTATLRLTTLATGLLALLFAMLCLERLFGTPAALTAGLLVGTDPTFFFLSLHEWGPFTTLFLCRAVGFGLLLHGWQTRKPLFWVLGGLALGLGVYARADFVVIPAAVLLAAQCARPEIVSELRARWREAVLALAAATLGALPMLISLGGIWTTSGGVGHRGGFG
ncbi:MAG: glycosyltransferase family 39 protein, partial [Proteobacteria bacterium]|nr:glycosyltransferase family 39 protein [Pseudomonadota bacterium]